MSSVDFGEYCRRVEDHLTRANAGHLVRIVGPGFELVRGWAEAGVPLSVVYRGIDLKAERHREGASKRPLRIEFCAGDVQAIFDRWRRAVGIAGLPFEAEDASPEGETAETSKRPSLGRHLDRVIDRMSRAAGRVDMPEGLRAICTRVLGTLAELKESSKRIRGDARAEVEAALEALDREVADGVRLFSPSDWMTAARSEAAADLAPFRSRLPQDAWEHSMDVTVDRLLRGRLGLPFIQL